MKHSLAQRRPLGPQDFVFPDKAPGPGSFPIPDRGHAEQALRDCHHDGNCDEVRAAIRKRFGVNV